MALFNELEGMAGQGGFPALVQAVQAAFFGGDLAALGADLAEEEAVLWAQIVAGVSDGEAGAKLHR